MNTPLRFLALGDSYTVGEGLTVRQRWPVLLVAALREAGYELAWPRIIARTGWTVDELASAVSAADPPPRWDLVSLLVGVNDQYRGHRIDAVLPAYRQLLARTCALAEAQASRVVAVSIPDWSLSPFASTTGRDLARVAHEIDDWNAAERSVADELGVRWVDITDLSRTSAVADGFAPDGLHPGEAQYRCWVDDAILPAVRALLPTP